jgi:precorrin-3B C17-methyltransferase
MSAGKTGGALFLVGTGPGDPRLLTRYAEDVLRTVDAVFGYALYVDLLRPTFPDLDFRPSAITEEEQRARAAVGLALGGKRVALIGSGDAGVYGLAGLALELLEAQGRDDLPVEVVPGVTAALSAAALLGAPLGHDFCAISLSDLLTPWEVIRRRLLAAAEAGFVTVLYNPASRRRTSQLGETCGIFLAHRRPDTPVGLVTNAYRDGQRVRVVTLDRLADEAVDMLTTVVIGNTATRSWNGRMITPRGYLAAPAPGAAVQGER